MLRIRALALAYIGLLLQGEILALDASNVIEEARESAEQSPPLVSVIVSPATYDGKVLLLKGYLTQDDDLFALYLSEDDAEYVVRTHAIRVLLTAQQLPVARKLVGKFVRVQGHFKSEASPLPEYPGSLSKITRLRAITPRHARQ